MRNERGFGVEKNPGKKVARVRCIASAKWKNRSCIPRHGGGIRRTFRPFSSRLVSYRIASFCFAPCVKRNRAAGDAFRVCPG